jgi:hypothetical protein
VSRVGIVGGGVAGTAAAYALRDGAVSTTLFEAAPALGGRTASRERDGCRYDLGASYVKAADDRFERVIADALPAADRTTVEGRVWLFDGDGGLREGRPPEAPRVTGVDGVDALARGLADRAGATVATGTRVASLARTSGGWRLDAGGDAVDVDGLVLATPPGEAARLLGGADWDAPLRDRVASAADAVPVRPTPSVALHYPFGLERPYYALLSRDPDHPVGWLAREESKPGHVPDGESLLVVQMSPAWTAGTAPGREAAVECAAESAAALLDDDRLREPDWTDAVLWTAAQPDRGVDPSLFERALRHDLALAGDWVAGVARTYAALQTGLDAGRRLGRRLRGPDAGR